MATDMTNKDTKTNIAHDTTQMAVPQNSVNEEFEVTYTFEAQSYVTTNRTEWLPSTSLHVLEEISADENIGMVDRGNEQGSTAADFEQVQHATNNNTDDVEANLSLQVPSVQPEVHNIRNIQNDLDLWASIHEYDQLMADEGFTQVLSKSQNQSLKNQVIGKALSNPCEGWSSSIFPMIMLY